MNRLTVTSDDAARVRDAVGQMGSLLLVGERGIGKSHLLREVSAAISDDGPTALTVAGTPAAGAVPLGAFAGMLREHDGPLTPSAVIAALTRRRSRTLLLVDAVDLLDEGSQLVVSHLVRSAGMTAILTARDLADCPPEVRALYDAGLVSLVQVEGLGDAALSDAIASWLGGPATPGTLREILHAAEGNPLIARELAAGSVATGALQETAHGWELEGPIAATPRLSQVVGAHLDALDQAQLEAAALIALAGSLPASAVAAELRRPLLRSGVIARTDDDWLESRQPLLAEAVRARVVDELWRDLAREAVDALTEAASTRPSEAGALLRRGAVIALDHDLPLDPEHAVDLASHALGAGDPGLALRAATAALEATENAAALRIRGLAASALGRTADADQDLRAALALAGDDAEITAAALALAGHVGVAGRDARGALAVLTEARERVTDPACLGHLDHASVRWTSVAGAGGLDVEPPEDVAEAEAAMGLATMATAAVITGPLPQAEALLQRFRALPGEVLAEAPGAAALAELASIMAQSYTGDIRATRERLVAQIDLAVRHAPETSGAWEYALGIVELFAADAGTAHGLACDAVQHLEWRDPMGLLPAATALRAATASAAGLDLEAAEGWRAVPDEAAADPKVAVLRCWGQAWDAAASRRRTDAGANLRAGAEAMLEAQHTFFAGKLAHCAIRVGAGDDEALALLTRAHAIGDGGLLELLLEHGRAMSDADADRLDALAEDMVEVGVVVSAADTWLTLAQQAERFGRSELDARRWQVRASSLLAAHPGMALWQREQSSAGALLSRREYEVAALAAQRLTAKEIAAVNDVSPHTVTNQLSSAFRKLGVTNRAELREIWAELGSGARDYP